MSLSLHAATQRPHPEHRDVSISSTFFLLLRLNRKELRLLPLLHHLLLLVQRVIAGAG